MRRSAQERNSHWSASTEVPGDPSMAGSAPGTNQAWEVDPSGQRVWHIVIHHAGGPRLRTCPKLSSKSVVLPEQSLHCNNSQHFSCNNSYTSSIQYSPFRR